MRKSAIIATVIGAGALLASSSATGGRTFDWPEVARNSDGDCTMAITGNGKFFRIEAAGLGSGSSGRYVLTNGDMKPIDWRITAGTSGRFIRYYLPFRWGHAAERIDGGTVRVSVATARCTVSGSFAWKRSIRVID